MLVLKYSFSTTVCARLSSKLERYQLEEQRLRERVRELAEQNVLLQRASFHERDAESSYSFEVRRLREQVRGLAENNVQLQREVSAYRERDAESKSKITCFEQQLEDLSKRVEDMNEENQDLKRNLLELQENNRAEEEELESFRLEVDSLQHENTDLQDLLKGNGKENEGFSVRLDKETLRLEVDSLQHENVDLQDLLKGNGKENEGFTVTSDKETWRLPRLLAERNLMWEAVLKYAEMNMLLNLQLVELKNKVNELDDEVVLMDRQIANFKDVLMKQSKCPLMEQGKRRCWAVNFPTKKSSTGIIH